MKNEPFYLNNIRDAVARIVGYCAGGRDAFFTDTQIRDAVLWNLQVIGEATKKLSVELKARRADIRYRDITGMRDLLVPHYFRVDLERVWKVIQTGLGPLDAAVASLLGEVDPTS